MAITVSRIFRARRRGEDAEADGEEAGAAPATDLLSRLRQLEAEEPAPAGAAPGPAPRVSRDWWGVRDPLAPRREFPRVPRFGRDYWLGRCTGWRVDGGLGRSGHVEALQFESRHDRPDRLVVCTSMLRRRLVVPVEDVAELDPAEQRLRLSDGRTGPRPR